MSTLTVADIQLARLRDARESYYARRIATAQVTPYPFASEETIPYWMGFPVAYQGYWICVRFQAGCTDVVTTLDAGVPVWQSIDP
jgi:hypothetical protein